MLACGITENLIGLVDNGQTLHHESRQLAGVMATVRSYAFCAVCRFIQLESTVIFSIRDCDRGRDKMAPRRMENFRHTHLEERGNVYPNRSNKVSSSTLGNTFTNSNIDRCRGASTGACPLQTKTGKQSKSNHTVRSTCAPPRRYIRPNDLGTTKNRRLVWVGFSLITTTKDMQSICPFAFKL